MVVLIGVNMRCWVGLVVGGWWLVVLIGVNMRCSVGLGWWLVVGVRW